MAGINPPFRAEHIGSFLRPPELLAARAAHAAAAPHDGVNALDAVLTAFTAINALRQQVRSDARIHGIITHGGESNPWTSRPAS